MRQQSPKRQARKAEMLVIGMDLGDRSSKYCVLDGNGEIRAEGSVSTTKKAMTAKFAGIGRCRMAVEVGTHSPWVSRLLNSLGHEVIVENLGIV
jgi:hypothetical protein